MPTLEQLQAALRSFADDPILHFSMANAYRDAGRPDEALHHYGEATRLKPDYSAAWFELARLAEREGRLEVARVAYAGAIEASGGRGDDHILNAAKLRLRRLDAKTGQSDR
jgi:tetratricopeptide (TPR) repeat protein